MLCIAHIVKSCYVYEEFVLYSYIERDLKLGIAPIGYILNEFLGFLLFAFLSHSGKVSVSGNSSCKIFFGSVHVPCCMLCQ